MSGLETRGLRRSHPGAGGERREVLRGVDDIAVCELTHRDVVRHSLVQAIVKAYEKYEKKNER